MRKKNKLYTANKWNRRLFDTGGYTTEQSASDYANAYVSNLNNSYFNKNGQSYSANVNTPSTVVYKTYSNNALQVSQNTTDNSSTLLSQIKSGNIQGNNRQEGVDYTQQQQGGNGSGNTSLLENALKTGINVGAQALNGAGSGVSNAGSGAVAGASAGSSIGSGITSGLSNQYNSFLNGLVSSSSTPIGLKVAALGSLADDFHTTSTNLISNMGKLGSEGKLGSGLLSSGASTGAGAAGKTFLQGFKGAFGADKLSSLEGAGIGIGANIVGGIGKSLLSDGLSTPTGDNIASIGSMIGSGVSMINPIIGGAVTLASNLIGGVVNGGWGHKTYNTAQAKNYLNNMSGFKVGGSNDDVEQLASYIAPAKQVTYKDGWFTNKGKKQAREWNRKTQAEYDYAMNSVKNAAQNNINSTLNSQLANYSALGGQIDSATSYGLMTDWINAKNKNMESRNKVTSMPNSFFDGNNAFAIGGVLQSHGSNFGNEGKYKVGDIIDVDNRELEELRRIGYDFEFVQ